MPELFGEVGTLHPRPFPLGAVDLIGGLVGVNADNPDKVRVKCFDANGSVATRIATLP